MQGVAIAIPIACNLAKQHITGAEESHYFRYTISFLNLKPYFHISLIFVSFANCSPHSAAENSLSPCSSHSSGFGSRSGKSWKAHNQLKHVWLIVYALLGAASWLIWRQGGLFSQKDPLGRYACLLAANVLCWPPVFYGGHSKSWAFLDTAGEFLWEDSSVQAECSV